MITLTPVNIGCCIRCKYSKKITKTIFTRFFPLGKVIPGTKPLTLVLDLVGFLKFYVVFNIATFLCDKVFFLSEKNLFSKTNWRKKKTIFINNLCFFVYLIKKDYFSTKTLVNTRRWLQQWHLSHGSTSHGSFIFVRMSSTFRCTLLYSLYQQHYPGTIFTCLTRPTQAC